MVPLHCEWVYYFVYMCACFCVWLQLGPIECQSLLWLSLTDFNNGCIHFGLGSRLQAPGRRETVNKPQLAASCRVTQQPGCPFFFSGQCGVRIVEGTEAENGSGKRKLLNGSEWRVCVCVIMQYGWPPGGCASGAVVPGGPWRPLPRSPSAPPASGLCSAPGCLWSSPGSGGAAETRPDLTAQINPNVAEVSIDSQQLIDRITSLSESQAQSSSLPWSMRLDVRHERLWVGLYMWLYPCMCVW